MKIKDGGLTLLDSKIYHKATIIKTIVLAEDTYIDQHNIIKGPEINPIFLVNQFLASVPFQLEKKSSQQLVQEQLHVCMQNNEGGFFSHIIKTLNESQTQM